MDITQETYDDILQIYDLQVFDNILTLQVTDASSLIRETKTLIQFKKINSIKSGKASKATKRIIKETLAKENDLTKQVYNFKDRTNIQAYAIKKFVKEYNDIDYDIDPYIYIDANLEFHGSILELIRKNLRDIEGIPKDKNDIERIYTLINTTNEIISSIYLYCIVIFRHGKKFLSKDTIKTALDNAIETYGLQKFDNFMDQDD